MDPGVKATFTLGSTTWLSFATASNFKNNGNATGGMIGIGSRYYNNDTRGSSMNGGSGTSIGIGMDPIDVSTATRAFKAASWSPSIAYGTGTGCSWSNTDVRAYIAIAKIVWGDATTPTTITVDAYVDGTALSEASFDASAVKTTHSVTVDPSTFDWISLGGARCNYDELRIGSTFADAIGVVAASAGNFWAPVAGGGGTGTWSSASTVWATAPLTLGTLAQSSTDPLIFSGAAGTVTIDGTVTAVAGLEFATDLYSVVAGTSTPNLSLTGADAAANELNVASGTTTISAEITGINGLTKDGNGKLVLSGPNTYGGGTMLNGGTLQIADTGSLGTGSVTFGGGTLQYPAGSGTTAVDVSSKIAAVATGQVANIDTNGYDVTFGSAIGGLGGLTKLGGGSLTLAAANTYSGPTTVSAGTLNVSSASGTIATLNVPAGGTVNLGAGAVVTTLNVSGGTVNITGTGVQVATLLGSAGTIDASLHALTVTQSAELGGVTATLTGGTSFTLGGANLIAPSALNHTIITSTGGTLSFATTGLDAAIGISQPGTPARPTTATFSGNGAWALNGGAASDITSVYGRDNHAFHYMQVPSGDFDILVHVTGATNANVGLMARDTLTASVGNSAGIWTGLKATTMNGALTASDHATPGNPWLRIKKIGELVTTYASADGITYTQVQQQDYTAYPWGATTYIGLDLAQTTGAMGTAQGTYENVNFMGTASMPNWNTTELVLSGGAKASVGCKLKLANLTINSLVQPAGAYTASNTPGSISGAGALIIGDNSATVTLGSLSQPYTGSPRAATATTTPTGLTVTFTYNGLATAPTAQGDYTVVGTISDIYYEGSATGTLHITAALSDFQSWANSYLPADVSVPTDDSDGDGLNNQQEYAFGLNPTSGSSSNPVTQQLDKATRTFKYTRRATSGLNYSYESSTTLSDPWDVLTPDGSPLSNNASPVEEITVTVPADLLLNSKLFLRVKASP